MQSRVLQFKNLVQLLESEQLLHQFLSVKDDSDVILKALSHVATQLQDSDVISAIKDLVSTSRNIILSTTDSVTIALIHPELDMPEVDFIKCLEDFTRYVKVGTSLVKTPLFLRFGVEVNELPSRDVKILPFEANTIEDNGEISDFIKPAVIAAISEMKGLIQSENLAILAKYIRENR